MKDSGAAHDPQAFSIRLVYLETASGAVISPERFTVNVSKFPMTVESACKNTDFFSLFVFSLLCPNGTQGRSSAQGETEGVAGGGQLLNPNKDPAAPTPFGAPPGGPPLLPVPDGKEGWPARCVHAGRMGREGGRPGSQGRPRGGFWACKSGSKQNNQGRDRDPDIRGTGGAESYVNHLFASLVSSPANLWARLASGLGSQTAGRVEKPA